MEEQSELLKLIQLYNNTDRHTIKQNLKKILIYHDIKPVDIMGLGFSKNLVYGWTTKSNLNFPQLEQALKIAQHFKFDVKEFVKD